MFKSLSSWLTWLEQWHPQAIELGLERVSLVGKRLGVLSFTVPVITVAGTNGKGSTVTALASCYAACGYNTGVYTSPHLLQFNERIKCNQKPVTDSVLCDAFAVVLESCQDITLSYFEFTTLAALWIFKQAALDLIILEVGLGGRLDAVNIVDSDVAVITTIDYDHQAFLGETRESIAYEKAGILRAKRPAVLMETDIPASLLSVIQVLEVKAYYYGRDYVTTVKENAWCFKQAAIHIDNLALRPQIPISNFATAIMTTQLLQERLPISEAALRQGILNFHLPGRCSLVKQLPDVYVDVAHNSQSARRFRIFLDSVFQHGRCYALFSALSDKAIENMILPFADLVDEWYIAPILHPRAKEINALFDIILNITHKPAIISDNLILAFEELLARASKHDMIIVYGSFFTVGEILSSLI